MTPIEALQRIADMRLPARDADGWDFQKLAAAALAEHGAAEEAEIAQTKLVFEKAAAISALLAGMDVMLAAEAMGIAAGMGVITETDAVKDEIYEPILEAFTIAFDGTIDARMEYLNDAD